MHVSSYTLRTVLSWVHSELMESRHVIRTPRCSDIILEFRSAQGYYSTVSFFWALTPYSLANLHFECPPKSREISILLQAVTTQIIITLLDKAVKKISHLYFFTYENKQKIFWRQPAKNKQKFLVLLICNLNRTFV